MPNTTVQFYTEPTNLDYLMPGLRLAFGDLTGDVYSDTIMRTALVNGVQMLQRRWTSKYQVYNDAIVIAAPANISGYVYANTTHGQAYIPSGLIAGDVFRNPFAVFTQYSPPLIQSEDETAIILAAKLLLRKSQVSSSAGAFVSWRTEDVSYSNLGSERSLSKILESDQQELDDYFKSKIAQSQISTFPVAYIPGLDDIQLT